MRGVNDVALNHHVLVMKSAGYVLLATIPPTFAAANRPGQCFRWQRNHAPRGCPAVQFIAGA